MTGSSGDMIVDKSNTHTHTHRQTDRQTDTLMKIHRCPIGGGITMCSSLWTDKITTTITSSLYFY